MYIDAHLGDAFVQSNIQKIHYPIIIKKHNIKKEQPF